jgi:uncharacterized protein (DUF427 family)
MRVRFGGTWIADSEDVVLLHEPGRYPLAYFPIGDISADALAPDKHSTKHRDLGATSWYSVVGGGETKARAAWQHTDLPEYASELRGRVAFAWRTMEAFFEEDERIVGHATDSYHRIDIRRTTRHLIVRAGDQVVADSTAPLVLYESGFAPRWYVPRADVDESALNLSRGRRSARTKGWRVTTRSARWLAWLGLTRMLGRRSGGSRGWCPSSPTRSKWNWTEYGCDSSRGRAWYRMVWIGI